MEKTDNGSIEGIDRSDTGFYDFRILATLAIANKLAFQQQHLLLATVATLSGVLESSKDGRTPGHSYISR